VPGRLEAVGDIVTFIYGRSYMRGDDAIAIYLPELPLGPSEITPPPGMRLPGSIADGARTSGGSA
jgi:serine/threonine-protein kinase HipA